MKNDLLQALAVEINEKSGLEAVFNESKTPGEFSAIIVNDRRVRTFKMVIALGDDAFNVFGGVSYDNIKNFEYNNPNSIDQLIVYLKKSYNDHPRPS